jgi:hypothetical protein
MRWAGLVARMREREREREREAFIKLVDWKT